VRALRTAIVLGAAAAALYGAIKFAEPGGGVLVHAAYLSRVALLPPRCEPHVAAAMGAQRALSVCLTFRGDAQRDLLEWLTFHRLQGVQRFDVFWDVVHEQVDTRAYSAFIQALRPDLGGGGSLALAAMAGGGNNDSGIFAAGDVFAWSRTDIALLAERIVAASVDARGRGGAASCAPDDADLAALAARIAECRDFGGWLCQGAVNSLCLAAAKVRGDDWLGLFDADEYIFAPGRQGRERMCFWGGAPGHGEGDFADCVVPLSESPLLARRDLPSVLRERYSVLASSVVIEGVAFGLAGSGVNGTGPREGLLTQAHGRSAAYDAEGLLVPPPGFTSDSCPQWFCGVMVPKKSFLRVRHAPVAGVRVHHHDTGPFVREQPVAGAALRLNHFPFDDIPALIRRGRLDIAANQRIAPGDRNGIADYMSAIADESTRALVPLVAHCMRNKHRLAPECRPIAAAPPSPSLRPRRSA
jgi:hypothetical protein